MKSITPDRSSGRKLTTTKRTVMFAQLFILQAGLMFGQKITYDNFEGSKYVRYTERTGVLDTLAKNPRLDNVNSSEKCALYIRNAGKKFDNIKMELPGKMVDVSEYATYLGIPPKIKIKLYTNAPVGTLVEILLGDKNGNNDYPAGTNSQFQVYTTKTNAWEELEFKFSQIPQGSKTSTSDINQITLLFNPNSSTSDAYYFDEITGPGLAVPLKQEPIAKTPEEKKPETPKKTEVTKKEKTSNKKQ